MKIIVIGASGFIGTYLVNDLIDKGHQVITTGRNKKAREYFTNMGCQHIDLDIRDMRGFEKLPVQGVDGVVLLAGLLPANVNEENTYEYIDVNITGTANVLEFCRKNGIKKLISTTSYADLRNVWDKNIPLSSDALRSYSLSDDHTLYIISKNAASDIMLYYNSVYNMNCCIFRLPPVYGVGPHSGLYVNGQWRKSGFQIFIEKAQKGEDITIYGDKNVSRDIVYVKDVTQAFVKCLESDTACGMYNIASGLSSTLEEQVLDIIDVYSDKNNKSVIYYDYTKGNNSKSYSLDITKAVNDFGYNPQYVPFHKLVEAYKNDSLGIAIPHLKNQYHD